MNQRPSALPRWMMILYASGSLAVALFYQALGAYIQLLTIDSLGLAPAFHARKRAEMDISG